VGVRIAVIGTGYLGRHHARILAGLPGADLAGIVDSNPARAAAVAAEFSVPAYPRIEALPVDLRAVTIAVPTAAHRSVTLAALARGWDVMVEKPLSGSTAEAREIVEAARSAGVILQVGHTERYNPAFQAAARAIRDPRFIEVHRLGVFTARSVDVDVILDVMIHDLDLIRSLDPSPPASVAAVGVSALTGKMDIANARIRFASGCVANLTASRVSGEKVRKIRVFQEDSYLSVDTDRQEASRVRLRRGPGGEAMLERERMEVTRDEPLRAELASFLEVVDRGSTPLVSGSDALAALELAERVQQAIREGGS
jgi:predicted dehydrogenase